MLKIEKQRQAKPLLVQKAIIELHLLGWTPEQLSTLFGLNSQQVEDYVQKVYEEKIQQEQEWLNNFDLGGLMGIHSHLEKHFDSLGFLKGSDQD